MKVNASMAEVWRENPNMIEREIVAAGPAGPNFRFPENREANRKAWASAPNFAILEDHPVTVPVWLLR